MSRLDDPFEQHKAEQLDAGFRAIVRNLREFHDLCVDQGFSEKQAFELTRDMFAAFMDRFVESEPEGEEG